jgi:type II restriction/modification system DNA methylase subunit YeeA
MNKNKLKAYAPAARREFIQAVTDRANLMGLSEGAFEQAELRGDVMLIAGRAYPKEVYPQRQALEARVRRESFRQVVEEAAYSWFNRLTALRYMELHGYLDHGLRVLSNPSGSHIPEILEKAMQVELPGLSRERIVAMKLDGNKDAELYRNLLVAQCNQLQRAMPFLFERINDETELLLPDNLLHSDSLIRKLVIEIDEEDWQRVEIIGWLYQFYISERKDEVIGKVVKSEDIPAATQLFTPNWIVKYMVQNSVGRMWLQTYPASALKGKMEYYIEPAEQTSEVEAQLKRITPEQIDPETITVLDPACGSGHILVEAYDVLKEIYQERGYRQRDIARLILEKNLYGLDIDERAAQLAGFALLMKARGDDRRILEDAPQLNVLAIEESARLKAEELAGALLEVRSQPRAVPMVGEDNLWGDMSRQQSLTVGAVAVEKAGASAGVSREEIVDLLQLFREGKTLGSLISVPDELARRLPAMREMVEENLNSGELYAREAANTLLPFVRQAEVLAGKYDCVIANPPYMDSRFFNTDLKIFAQTYFPASKSNLFSLFMEFGFRAAKREGFNTMVTMQNWMFLSSFEDLRGRLLETKTIATMAHLGARAFGEISGEVVQTTSFIIFNHHLDRYKPAFFRLVDGNEEEKRTALLHGNNRYDHTKQDDFHKIPGSPVAYWLSSPARNAFDTTSLSDFMISEGAVKTGDNDRFLRLFWEISNDKFGYQERWREHAKGGDFRKWYGNLEWVVDWSEESRLHYQRDFIARILPQKYWDLEGICWTAISGGESSFRKLSKDEIANNASLSIFPINPTHLNLYLGYLNSDIIKLVLEVISPTLNYLVGDILKVPFAKILESFKDKVSSTVDECLRISRVDWDSFETSWDFQELPLLRSDLKASTVEESFNNWQAHCDANIRRMQELETENNRLFIEAYGLQDELSAEVPAEQITLARADAETDTRRLISYATGCMMGRYSLDRPGLVYANSAGVGFNPSQYKTFPADKDGIIPVTDLEWFARDAANRFVEFLSVAWSPETLEENLRFVAAQLSPRQNEQPRDTVRRYFSSGFFKDHMQTYKKRPVYWLFSSGKQKAFECLVYLHRYSPATLSRMRNEYVTPLFGKLSAQIEYLTGEVAAATSTAARNKLQKTLDALKKKHAELQAFDAELRHYADQRIALDLDDGVKVNYGKFGNLLAETKTIAAESE